MKKHFTTGHVHSLVQGLSNLRNVALKSKVVNNLRGEEEFSANACETSILKIWVATSV
jgi:hypothetical protein